MSMLDPEPSPESEAEIKALVPKRRLWPILLVLLAIAGAAAYVVWRIRTDPLPLRVLVAIDMEGYWWEGSQPAAVIADRLSGRLEKLGFDTVRGGDPGVTKVLERAKSPEEAAKKLRASFLVTAHIVPQVTEHPVQGGYFETRIDAPIEVRFLKDPPGEPGRVRSWSGGKSRSEAVRLVAESAADQAFDETLSRITAHRSIQDLFKGSDASMASKVGPARNYVEQRDKALKVAADLYEDLGKKRKARSKGPYEITWHSRPEQQHTLAGTGPRGYLTKTSDKRLFFSPDNFDLGWISELDSLEWRDGASKREALWTGYNLYGYPAAAPGGSPAVLVEDIFGWAKTVTVVDADGKSRRVRVDPSHRFVNPKVAPGGKLVALYDRACRNCPASIHVLSLDDGRAVFEKKATEGEYSGFDWIDGQRLALVRKPLPGADAAIGDRRAQELWLADLSANPPSAKPVHTFHRDAEVVLWSASPQAHLIALEVRGMGAQTLGLLDSEGRQLKTFQCEGLAEAPLFSADGKVVVYAAGGDIHWMVLETGKTTKLTDTPYEERYPHVSEDNTRVYFESLADDPNFPGHRVVSAVASVPAPR
ncbi:MAG: hypothetical protein HY898_18505 [Deltaproteobacteria bacterium]|nr:hypothetical protein [Deltaproteobacteria bacterium]